MEGKQEVSYGYGVIPVVKEAGGWQVFLIHQYGSAGDVYWTFPKGHAEEGETPEESARRELKEETGIVLASLDTTDLFEQQYSFQYEGRTITRIVTYFLGIAQSKDFVQQDEEIKEAGWFTFEEALNKLTYSDSKKMLELVAAKLFE